MNIIWSTRAWDHYLYWQKTDPKMLKRINRLIADIQRQLFDGPGEPEPLKYNWSGYWSRRIDQEHRLIYKIADHGLFIAQCRYHY